MRLKLLPCKDKGDKGPHCLDGIAKLLPERWYVLAHWPGGDPFVYQCRACKRTSQITVIEFNSLPEINVGDLPQEQQEAMAMDLTLGRELPIAHAVDLARAGFTMQDVLAMNREAG